LNLRKVPIPSVAPSAKRTLVESQNYEHQAPPIPLWIAELGTPLRPTSRMAVLKPQG